MVPQLQLYKSLILAKQKELITGVTQAPTIEHQDLPRQNNDRENAILGAQGQSESSGLFSKFLQFYLVEEDIQGDWLDRFYSFIKIGLILMTLYNYNSSGKFSSYFQI